MVTIILMGTMQGAVLVALIGYTLCIAVLSIEMGADRLCGQRSLASSGVTPRRSEVAAAVVWLLRSRCGCKEWTDKESR
jgi:hypothetical protein